MWLDASVVSRDPRGCDAEIGARTPPQGEPGGGDREGLAGDEGQSACEVTARCVSAVTEAAQYEVSHRRIVTRVRRGIQRVSRSDDTDRGRYIGQISSERVAWARAFATCRACSKSRP
jgi:hypothetical protein